ncbi:MAG: tetratricopeptide repeat protein [Oscillospiraceae bacterium]|jgi:tetratricopeptide (TPR) repeat protein|nr:tetratricopeptide repeat protein [Oscillospiraceae bacterium]
MSKELVECVHWDPEVDPVAQTARQKNRWVLLAGALVVIAVAVGMSLLFLLPKRAPAEPPAEPGQATSAAGWTDPGSSPAPTQPPPEDDPTLAQGKDYYKNQNYALALASLNRAIAANPDSGEAYTYRGLTQFAQQKYQEAIADFTQAMRRMEPNAELTLMRGTAHYLLALYPEAIGDLTRAIELSPGSVKAYEYRALAYEASGRMDLAQADRARIGG